MTISLCVIMLELTNDITLALPMVLALAMSKAAGDLISDPIYEVHAELMGVRHRLSSRLHQDSLCSAELSVPATSVQQRSSCRWPCSSTAAISVAPAA
eukprot:SAG22_NODE_1138_length_5389_cov_22.995085_8_plen_98_part_00